MVEPVFHQNGSPPPPLLMANNFSMPWILLVLLVQVHGIVALKANEPSGRLDGWNSAELLRGTTAIGSFCYT